MTTGLLIAFTIALPILGWLVLKFAKEATTQRERADQNERTAIETKKQAELVSEHITDDDVVRLLTQKAADKRKREAEG